VHPRIEAVLETSLYVSDLDRAIAFYESVLGLQMLPDSYFEGGRGAALQVGTGPSILLLFRAEITRHSERVPSHGASGPGHVAFRVAPSQIAAWRERLSAYGVAIEREVAFGDNPPSIYFRDPDGNSLELAVTGIWPLQNGSPKAG
jgi:catechol 2,3-dioxygenase-like lactoylglutathione lyase family enzyme